MKNLEIKIGNVGVEFGEDCIWIRQYHAALSSDDVIRVPNDDFERLMRIALQVNNEERFKRETKKLTQENSNE